MQSKTMKQGWEIKKLGECFEYIKNGANIKQERGAGGIPITRIETLSGGVFNRDRLGYADIKSIDKYHSYVMESGDLLLSHINSKSYIGRVVVYVKEGNETIIHGMNLLRLKVIPDLISPFYMYYYSQTHKFKSQIANRRKDAVNQSSISVADLKTIDVPVPPREEQERIVAELDCLSSVIERKREQLRELDALAQSIFFQMFGDPITNEKGWEVKKVKDIFSVKIGPFGSLLHNSDYISGGTPLVNPIHMHNERICPDYDFSVSDNKLKELGNYILHTDDIVLARRGDIGRCAIVGMNEDGYLCGTGSLFIRPITNINSNFIIKQIRCNTMIEHLTSLAKGATMLNINCKIVEELIVILPPLTLQQEFAEKIEAIEKQKELIKQSITQTEELFNSRMDYYFN